MQVEERLRRFSCEDEYLLAVFFFGKLSFSVHIKCALIEKECTEVDGGDNTFDRKTGNFDSTSLTMMKC